MTSTVDPQRIRLLFTAVTVGLSGYLLILSLNSQFPFVLSGLSPIPVDAIALLVLQLVIAVSALTFGWLVAPAPTARRWGAAAVGGGGVILFLIVTTVRLNPEFSRILANSGPGLMQTLGNAHFMVALAVALGWLIVTARSGMPYLLLLLVLVLAPVPYWMMLANVSRGIIQIAMLLLTMGIVFAIGALSRLFGVRPTVEAVQVG